MANLFTVHRFYDLDPPETKLEPQPPRTKFTTMANTTVRGAQNIHGANPQVRLGSPLLFAERPN